MASKTRFQFSWFFMVAGCATLLGSAVWADVQAARDVGPAAAVIDGEIRQLLVKAKVPASAAASDAEFLRRACLDLNGRLPSAQQAAAFLDSTAKNKRTVLIDELLARPEFGQHIARVWTKRILAVGTPGPTDTGHEFQAWLAEQINKGKGWNEIVRAVLTTDGPARSNPANFFFDANTDDGKFSPALMTGATTQLFLGLQVQCAECHNHPFTELKQTDFWGLATFFSRTARTGGGKKGGGPSEIRDGVAKSAVARPNKKKGGDSSTAATTDIGLPVIVIPASGGNKGSGKVVPAKFLFGDLPAKIRDPQPQPLRPYLAEWVATASNPFFAKNTANWAWAHLFGRGLIDPIDNIDQESVASHPAVLKTLSDEFVASGFDLRHLFRCICTSEAYGRSSTPLPDNKDDTELFSHMACKTIGAEVFHDMMTDVLAVKNMTSREPYVANLNKDGSKAAKGAKQLPQQPPRDQFIKSFTTEKNPDRQTEFTHGIPQMLRLMNAAELKNASPRIDLALAAGKSPEQAIEHLYLTTLTRRPQPDEVRLMLDYVRARPTLRDGYAGALWILVNSSEFQLNH